jgi:integrase
LGKIFKRSSTARWYTVVYRAPDDRGVMRQRWETCKGMNKKQAEDYLRAQETAVAAGRYLRPTEQTVEQYLREWADFAREQRLLADTTRAEYLRSIRVHLIPHLGKYKLAALSPMHIQKAYARLTNHNAPDADLSPAALHNIHAALRKALKQAVKWRLIAANPCDGVELPALKKPTIRIAAPPELAALRAALEGHPYRLPILIALATGMRRGEVLALKWADYHAADRTLTVQRALYRADGEVREKGTKKENVRVVQLGDALAAELDIHRVMCPEAAAGDFINARPNGAPLSPNGFSKSFMWLSRKLGLGITLHSLRHTQATVLLAAGVLDIAVAQRLGHSSVMTTKAIYAHVMQHTQEDAARIAEQTLLGGE